MTDEDKGNEVIEVELEDGPPCPACGTIGAHYCPGPPRKRVVYAGVRKVPNSLDKASSTTKKLYEEEET